MRSILYASNFYKCFNKKPQRGWTETSVGTSSQRGKVRMRSGAGGRRMMRSLYDGLPRSSTLLAVFHYKPLLRKVNVRTTRFHLFICSVSWTICLFFPCVQGDIHTMSWHFGLLEVSLATVKNSDNACMSSKHLCYWINFLQCIYCSTFNTSFSFLVCWRNFHRIV